MKLENFIEMAARNVGKAMLQLLKETKAKGKTLDDVIVALEKAEANWDNHKVN